MKKLFILFLASLCFTVYSSPTKKSVWPLTKIRAQAEELLPGASFKFRKNMGQMSGKTRTAADKILYTCKVPGMDLYITTEGLNYFFYKNTETKKPASHSYDLKKNASDMVIAWERVEMKLEGAHIGFENCIGDEQSSTLYNYFTAAHPDGIYNVREYGALTIRNVYPGIDWVLYNSKSSGFKYDFIVHPGADASLIKFKYHSLSPLTIDQSGALHLRTKFGSLDEQAPYSYIRENNIEIKSTYKIEATTKNEETIETLVSYQLQGDLARDKTLVIDPVLYWATTYGGSFNDRPKSIDTDKAGNIFVTGHTQSTDFIVQNAGTYFQGTGAGNGKAFIMKFSPSNALIWSTFYGGTGSDAGSSVAVDSLQNIVVSGYTYSVDFPTLTSGTYFQGTYAGSGDAFLLKFNNSGTRLWATYYGGSDLEWGISVCTDKNGNIFMGGITYSQNFPLQNAGTFYNAAAPSQGNDLGYVVKFSKTGTRLWSTYYDCDRIHAIATDDKGNLFVTGFTYNTTHTLNPGNGAYFQPSGGQTESFIGKFDNAGNMLWATYYGGNRDDYGKSIVADKFGNVFMGGVTRSINLPMQGEGNTYQYSMPTTTPSSQTDVFLTKFDSAGVLKWATYYGGTNYEEMGTFDNLELDDCNRLYVSFESASVNTNSININLMASCEGGFYSNAGNNFDQFVARFSNTGTLQWATLIGGDGPDQGSALAVDKNGDLFMTGCWQPTSAGSYTAVNPGNGAYFNSSAGTSSRGVITKFTNMTLNTPPAYSYPAICANLTTVVSPVLTGSFVLGGTFAAPGLNINPATGIISLTNATPGTYSVSYITEQCQCIQSVGNFVVYSCLGMNESKTGAQRLSVYANPNAGTFILKSESALNGQLINELGQTVLEFRLSPENDYRQTVTNLTGGVYVARSPGGKIFTKIVVLK